MHHNSANHNTVSRVQNMGGLASFVADHLNYEPLEKPRLLVSDHFSLIKNKCHPLLLDPLHISSAMFNHDSIDLRY